MGTTHTTTTIMEVVLLPVPVLVLAGLVVPIAQAAASSMVLV
jgi:hypothetical protein